MEDKFEKAVKHKCSLSALRNLSTYKEGFENAFMDSLNPVIDKVNSRFERMKLKGNNVIAYKGVSIAEIKDSFNVVCDALGCNAEQINADLNSAELRKVKNLQV